MGVCFLCDTKLYGECTQVCSNITPHSNVPYPDKIAELMGDEVVVIVTPADQMCNNCISLLTHMDKLENDLKIVKNAMLSYIQKKYGILPPDHHVEDLEVVEQLEQGQRLIPSGLRVEFLPTLNTAAVVTPVQTPFKMSNAHRQHQKQQQQQPTTQLESVKKMNRTYMCKFCKFQSKELGRVRLHIRVHTNKQDEENSILNQAAAKALLTPVPQQNKQLYTCQVCAKTFDMQINCLDHIQKDHYQPTSSISSGERETDNSCPVTTKVIKAEPFETQENNQQAELYMDVDKNQQDNNKGTADKDMMLNDHAPTEGSADVKQEEETENSQEDKTVKEDKCKEYI